MKKKNDSPNQHIPERNSKSNKKPPQEQSEKLNNKLKKALGKDLRKLENIAKKKVGEKPYRENTQFIREFLEERVGKNNKASRIKTANDLEKLHYRLKKFDLIRKKAEERFDKLISFTGVEIDSLKTFDFVPGNDGVIVMKENDKYERSKEIFVNIIQNHFRANKIIISEISEGLPIAGELKEAKVADDITDVMDKIIDKVIDRYVKSILLILGIAPPLTSKVKNEIEQIFSDNKKEITHLKREKEILHNELDKENVDDSRIPKKKCEDYIKEVLQVGDKNLKKVELANQIRKRILIKYPGKRFSKSTIQPKLSYITLP